MSTYLERVRRLSEAAKRAAQAAQDAREARDDAILDANDAGHSHGELAKVSGMSRIRISHICGNVAAARQAALARHIPGHDEPPLPYAEGD